MSKVDEVDGQPRSDSSVLADLVDRLTAKMQAGEAIDWEDVARQHPEHADELLRLRPALGALGELSRSGAEELSGVAPPAALADGLASGVLGDFRIIREIGRGGMGVVYEAEQISLHRRVALKVLPFAATMDPRHLQRFQNEARAAACLHHSNIVPVHYVGSERGVYFYAMQFIDGQTLAEVIRELRRPTGPPHPQPLSPKGRGASFAPLAPWGRGVGGEGAGADPDIPTTAHVPPDRVADPKADTEPAARQSTLATLGPAHSREYFRRVAELGVQAAEALDHAHQLGIVHRDVKPGNLLLDGSGRVWVADFGLAHMQHGEASMTMTGDLVGTLRYMSPEQALAKRVPIDHRTDVYSLGATLYELLTLRPAFEGKDRQEVLRQIAFEEPKPPRHIAKGVPGELENIVLKAMSKNPADRYGTAQEMADDLRRFLDDKPIRARRPSWRKVAARWARRHRTVVWAASVLFVLAAVLGGVNLWWVERQQAETERAVREHLQRAAAFQEAGQWEEAQKELGRAEERLAGGGPAALAERVRTLQMDATLVTDLDEAALQLTAGGAREGLDYAGADAAYAAAFVKRGLDFTALSTEEAATRIRRSAVRARAIEGLDDWAVVKENLGRGRGERLLAVARLADDDAWRQRLRDPMVCKDKAALVRLAQEEGVLDQPAANLVVLSKRLDDTGAQAEAESLLRRAQQRYPADFWTHLQLAFVLSEYGSASEHSARLAESVGCCRAALALRPQSAIAHNDLGDVLDDQGKLEAAGAEFRTAIGLKPNYAEAHRNLGNILHDQGKREGAGAEFRKAVALKPDLAEAHSDLGAVLHDQGKPEEAEAECRKAIALKPDFAEAHSNLGAVLHDQGKPEEAEAECRKAIALKPDFANAHSNLGTVLTYQGKLEEAEAEFRKAVALKPDYADAHSSLGAVLLGHGKLEEAEAECRKAIALKPDYANAHSNLGTVLTYQGKLEEAEAEFRKAVALNPDLAEAHSNLGNILCSQGKLEEAEAECRKAITLNPDFEKAHYNLGVVLREMGQFAEALTSLKRAQELGHRGPGLSLLVKTTEPLARLDTTLPVFLKGEAQPANAGVGVGLALVCHYRHRYAAAARFSEEAFAANSKLGEDLASANRYNAACAAALAGCGQGKDADSLDEKERARLRRQALDWLRADLTAWKPWLNSPFAQSRAQAAKELADWREDPDLAGVRDADALMKLPDAERAAWRQLWADLDALLPKTKP